MSKLLELISGNQIAPHLIQGIVKFPGKGVVFRNEFNKILAFEQEPDPVRQDVIVRVVGEIVNSGKNWQQPDWTAEFAKIARPAVEQKSHPAGHNKTT